MYSDDFFEVAPHVGAWIEITDIEFYLPSPLVAPHVGAWIEISCRVVHSYFDVSHPTWVRGLKYALCINVNPLCWSHPTWVRGLKFRILLPIRLKKEVAPHVGAWIEITKRGVNNLDCSVAPHVGAWIEISMLCNSIRFVSSHPTWVRGLKC